MSVGHEDAYDILLKDREFSPSIELGLILARERDSQGGPLKPRWSEGRVPPIPPRRSTGPLNWTHKDPITDFVWSQDNWEDGAFLPYYAYEDPARYGKSDGMDLRWRGVAALGPRRAPIRSGGTVKSRIQSNVFIANGDWEEGQVVGWSAGTGTTLALEATTVRTGNYAGSATVASGTSSGTAIVTQSFANPTVWQGREVTVIAYGRRSSGSDSTLTMKVTDSAGSTESSQSVSSDAWSYMSVTHTVDASATSVTIQFQLNGVPSTDHVFLLDDCYVIPTGGVQCAGHALRGSTDPHQIYAALGRCVVQWNESTYVWEAVYVDASAAATDIIEFDNTIYVAFGEADGSTPHQYIYGSSTSWTTAALNATTTHQDNHARHFTKARNGFGDWALWKAGPSTDQGTERHTLAWATDPTTAWSPTSYFTVGSASRNITGLYEFADTFIVTKVDGIWVWDGLINDFVVVTPEWDRALSEKNGAVGQTWHGDVFLGAVRQGFFQFAGSGLVDLSALLMAPRLTDFGGEITAMAATPRELIMGLDQPTADATEGKTSRLVRLRTSDQGRWQLHSMQEPAIGILDALAFHQDDRLWAFGRNYISDLASYVPAVTVWTEPSKTAAPYLDASPAIESTGYFETSIWHGGLPDTPKALIALTIWAEDLDTTHTIKAQFGVDGAATTAQTLGIFNKPQLVQTLLFRNITNPRDNAVGQFLQLRFTFDTDDTTSPKLYAFALHTQLVPPPIRVFELDAWVGGASTLRTGVPHELTKAEIEVQFKQLEEQVFPLTMLDDFGQAHGGEEDGAHVRQVRLVSYNRVAEDDAERGLERWRLVLQEVAIT